MSRYHTCHFTDPRLSATHATVSAGLHPYSWLWVWQWVGEAITKSTLYFLFYYCVQFLTLVFAALLFIFISNALHVTYTVNTQAYIVLLWWLQPTNSPLVRVHSHDVLYVHLQLTQRKTQFAQRLLTIIIIRGAYYSYEQTRSYYDRFHTITISKFISVPWSLAMKLLVVKVR